MAAPIHLNSGPDLEAYSKPQILTFVETPYDWKWSFIPSPNQNLSFSTQERNQISQSTDISIYPEEEELYLKLYLGSTQIRAKMRLVNGSDLANHNIPKSPSETENRQSEKTQSILMIEVTYKTKTKSQ